MTVLGRRLGATGRRFQALPQSAVPEPVKPVDANGVVLLWMRDATDNGSTLTVPNRLGGSPATSTGAGRPTYSATAVDDRFPGVVTTGITAQFSVPCDLSTRKAATIYIVCESRNSTFGAVTQSHLFAHGTGTERVYGRYDTYVSGPEGNVRAGKTSSIDTIEISVRDMNGGARSRPRVYCFTFDIDAAQEVGTPYGDNEALIIETYGGTASTGTLTNGTLYIGQSTALGQPFDGAIAAVYVRHGVHSAAERAEWTTYLQYTVGSQDRKRVAIVGDSRDYGSNAVAGGYRAYIQQSYDADPSLNRWLSFIGRYPVDSSKTFVQDYCLAVPGYTIAQCKAAMIADFGTHGGGVQQWHPDIILYCAAINDLGVLATPLQDIEDAHVDWVQTGASLEPTAYHVLIAPFYRTDDPAAEARRVTYVSTHMPIVLSRLQALGITRCMLDTTRAGLTGISMPDGLHPDQTANGYQKIAVAEWPRYAVWRDAA